MENGKYFGTGFYEPYEEYGKETDLKWYFCNLWYAKEPDNTKEGMTGITLYNNRNTTSFRNHVVTSHKRVFKHFFSYINGIPKIVSGDDDSSLEVSVETHL